MNKNKNEYIISYVSSYYWPLMTRSAEEFPECACRYAETKIEPDKKPTVIPRSKYRKENREKDVNVKFIYKSKLLSTVTQKSINSIDKNITNLVLQSRSEEKKNNFQDEIDRVGCLLRYCIRFCSSRIRTWGLCEYYFYWINFKIFM